ncbi:hypothetical protein [Methylobacterium haplocladii]|uniref:hypothetical protein n=1 Tax=Methylobacterium haplocladii TaxID=1176176 RepID=UPI001EE010DB|nr:hypothetical protein [Methylobacterium haplocladii]
MDLQDRDGPVAALGLHRPELRLLQDVEHVHVDQPVVVDARAWVAGDALSMSGKWPTTD